MSSRLEFNTTSIIIGIFSILIIAVGIEIFNDNLIVRIIVDIIAALGIIIFVILFVKLKFQQRDGKTELEKMVARLQAENLPQEEYLERLENTLISTKSDDIEVKRMIIPKAIFSGADEKKICGICKLEIRTGQEVFKCDECLWLFHSNHIAMWLVQHNKCPICSKKFEFMD